MFEADITKVVEEMAVRIRETEEDFILDTIFPYCQETLQRKINKAELKQIILRGSRPKGRWLEIGMHGCHATLKCSICNREIEHTFTFGEYSYEDIKRFYPYCHCGAEMSGGKEA